MRIRALLTIGLLVGVISPQSGAGAQAPGATLAVAVAPSSGLPGTTGVGVTVSLASDPGADVVSINFDLTFDSTRLTVASGGCNGFAVTIGAAAQAAGKSIGCNVPSPGRLVLVIAAINTTPISDGVVANITFNVNSSANVGLSTLGLANATAADSVPNTIPLTLLAGTFTVTAPPATNTPVPSATSISSATSTPTRTPTNTPTRTFTPTATRTPSSTPTRTNTPTSGPSPTPSLTPTASRTPTPGPSPTPVTPATSTRTPTRTATVIASPTSASTSPTPPTAGASAPAATSTAAASPSGSPTGPAGTPTFPPEIETAAAATGTALAELEEAVAATATALAGPTAGPPGNGGPSTPGPLAILAALLAAAALIVGICLLGWSWLRARRNRITPPAGPAL